MRSCAAWKCTSAAGGRSEMRGQRRSMNSAIVSPACAMMLRRVPRRRSSECTGTVTFRVGSESTVASGSARNDETSSFKSADDFSRPERWQPLIHAARVIVTWRMRGGSPSGIASPRAAQSSRTSRMVSSAMWSASRSSRPNVTISGNAGTRTVNPPSSSGSRTTANVRFRSINACPSHAFIRAQWYGLSTCCQCCTTAPSVGRRLSANEGIFRKEQAR